MVTVKAIRESYLGKRFNPDDPWSVVTKVVSVIQGDGTPTAVILSGTTSEYEVEALIDRRSGANLTPNRSRPADSIADACDVAMEMYKSR